MAESLEGCRIKNYQRDKSYEIYYSTYLSAIWGSHFPGLFAHRLHQCSGCPGDRKPAAASPNHGTHDPADPGAVCSIRFTI
jgi:hypothetical protein